MLVSVVIPSYNHKEYVAQAIDSVLGQSWPHVDLIVIDDGSTDGSADIIRAHHKQHGGYRYLCRDNQGLLRTLNEGLHMAHGEFFCELASDDYLPTDSLAIRVKYLQENRDCVAVFADGLLIEGEKLTDHKLVKDKRLDIFSAADPLPAMLAGVNPIFSTGLIRCEILRKIGGFDDQTFRYYEDLDTPILLSLQGRLGFLCQPVIYRRHHETNVSSSTSHVRVEKVLCYQKLLGIPQLAPHRQLLVKRLRRSLLALGRYLVSAHGGNERERRAFRQGWRFAWQDPRLLWLLLRWGW